MSLIIYYSPKATAKTGPGLLITAYKESFRSIEALAGVRWFTFVTAWILGITSLENDWPLSTRVHTSGIMLIPADPAALITSTFAMVFHVRIWRRSKLNSLRTVIICGIIPISTQIEGYDITSPLRFHGTEVTYQLGWARAVLREIFIIIYTDLLWSD